MQNTPKWQSALNESPLWLLQTFAGVLLVLAVLVFLCSKTRFGKEFALIVQPGLNRKSAVKVLSVTALMILLLLTEIRLYVLNTFLYNSAYSALQDKLAAVFWTSVLINAGVMLVRAVNGIVNDFLDQALAIRWSESLNRVLTERWLAAKNYYRLQMRRHAPDNIDQRIQQDAQDFIVSTIEFVRGMLNSVLSTIEFTVVLWGLAGVLPLFGWEIPRGIVFFVYIAILLATAVAMRIGKPLIQYNYENEKLNGDYRYSLIRVRDHAESVAFYNGEWREQQQLSQRFGAIIRNRWRIARQRVTLNGFNDLFSQGMQLLPLMLQAPRFFAGQIKIGDMQQTVQSFARLQKAMSFFRNFYGNFTAYRARLERLSGFFAGLECKTPPARPEYSEQEGCLKINGLTLLRSDGRILLGGINFELQAGQSLLLQGPSGCGKTSLLRALAGLWPFGSCGRVVSPPQRDILFVPQRPYMPQGSLIDTVCYPDIAAPRSEVIHTLRECRLDKWIHHLDEVSDWQQRLSPGELQRIAFARVLLRRPKLILLDEATSALDEPTEAHLYRLLRDRLPESMLVSIGHRCTLAQFHQRSLNVVQADCADR